MVRRYVVTGKVQGVGFRWFVRDCARRLDVGGWVRNEPDGSVLVLAEGNAEQQEALCQQLQVGPPSSRVIAVRVGEALATDATRELGSSMASDAMTTDSGLRPFYLVR